MKYQLAKKSDCYYYLNIIQAYYSKYKRHSENFETSSTWQSRVKNKITPIHNNVLQVIAEIFLHHALSTKRLVGSAQSFGQFSSCHGTSDWLSENIFCSCSHTHAHTANVVCVRVCVSPLFRPKIVGGVWPVVRVYSF